jgi:hypothetical protein
MIESAIPNVSQLEMGEEEGKIFKLRTLRGRFKKTFSPIYCDEKVLLL